MSVDVTYLIDIATGLSLTPKGEWVTEWQPNVRLIGRIGVGTIDSGTKQLLMSGDMKEEIVEKLGLWGDAKGAFEYGWDIALVASGAWGYYQGIKLLLSESGLVQKKDPIGDALKKLIDMVGVLDNKIDKILQLEYSDKRSQVKGPLDGVQTSIKAMLNAPGEYEREILRQKVEATQEVISGGLLDPQESTDWFSFPIRYSQYGGCTWYFPMSYGWSLRLAPPWNIYGSHGVPVWLSIGEGANRPDIRELLGVTLEGTVTLIAAHAVLDPAFRTTGRYRDTFLQFAEVLRSAAYRILAGIQVTRPIDLPVDANKVFYGDPAEWRYPDVYHKYWYPGTWQILADGWPVGAVDTVSGGAIIDTNWKPSEHGWPFLTFAGNLKRNDTLPPEPFGSMALAAIQAANVNAIAAYLELWAQSPAPTLFALADVFEEMARPPKTTETVEIDLPIWTGQRSSAGHVEENVGDIGCEVRTFTAEVERVDAKAHIRCRVQPELYRVGAQKINYKYFLEAPSLYSGDKLGYPPQGEGGRVELTGMSGTVTINAPDFRWNVMDTWIFPIAIVSSGNDSDTRPLPGELFNQLPTMEYIEPLNQREWKIVGPVPLKPSPGSIEATGSYRQLTITYERQEKDEISPTEPHEIKFTISAEPGSGNAMLWFVIEEPIGNPPPGTRSLLRSGTRLPVVTIEHRWPWAYFVHKELCQDARNEILDFAKRKAAGKKIPVPDPDPTRDKSFADYVQRVYQTIGLPTPISRESIARARMVSTPRAVRFGSGGDGGG